uniref:Uncharacterized protein n=1 Tax=Leviviridae sp. TaxID=2027243 RepID=A0A514D1J5_9VIRU|nr:MAG: hypothetical protein H4Rhizo43484_000002 [Leviviridae sp.]
MTKTKPRSSPRILEVGKRTRSRQERNLILICPVPTSKALVLLVGVLLVVADILPVQDLIQFFVP